jgi:thiamine-triphosphatase
MIEVEKKFVITPEQESYLLDGAEFLGEKIFTDSYFDYPDYRMTSSDLWLRKRDDRFELKVPLNDNTKVRVSDQYHELETDEEIASYLKIDLSGGKLEDKIGEIGMAPFCTITTTRKKYKKGEFGIDVDEMDFGYHICEIELMVSGEEEISSAEKRIVDFALSLGLPVVRVRGKVLEYLRLNNIAHMEAIERFVGAPLDQK